MTGPYRTVGAGHRPPVWRQAALAELGERSFDLLVIGGGIVGAGIANEASRAGLAVALVDRSDFGSQTSSASSKLVHGGLRYLRLGDVRLVHESHRERRALMHVVAPHLVRRLAFVLPLYDDGPYRPRTVRAALRLYSALAREPLERRTGVDGVRRRVPDLRLDGLQASALYVDASTHDARLCLANVRAAADAGATVLNHAEVVELRRSGGRVAGAEVRDRFTHEVVVVRARSVVNATGPWVDHLRRLEDPRAVPAACLSKGVHVVVPLERPWSAALTIPHDRVRVTFAVPWEGMLLLGTTDTPYEGDPGDVAVSEDDVATVLGEAARAVDHGLLARERVRATFAGLRVLAGAGEDTASARRETLFLRGAAGMLSIAGGKLTTYRRIALGALEELRPELGLRRLETRPVPVPGAADPTLVARSLSGRFPELGAESADHLAHLYGSAAADVAALGIERVHRDAPDVVGQIAYARAEEWACSDEDVVARRTTLAPRGLGALTLLPHEELEERR
ncbi:MAG: glycerol-3-phosphate dehydrogenase/oxidase [Actinobacteria bacterium]|nr:glycerol-3-phosphate dehydrogenase/oxidase [Actinomycetota bacterium]